MLEMACWGVSLKCTLLLMLLLCSPLQCPLSEYFLGALMKGLDYVCIACSVCLLVAVKQGGKCCLRL